MTPSHRQRERQRHRASRPPLVAGLLALLVLPACADPDADAARRAFLDFQSALFAGDVPALRRLVTNESEPAIEHLPLAALAERSALEVSGVERIDGGIQRVFVLDPQRPHAGGSYVVAREGGRWRVDLLASTLANNAHHAGVGYQIVPATAADIENAEARPAAGQAMR